MTERLNNDFFRRLAQSIPGFKAEYAKKAGEKKAQSNGKIIQPPCAICGRRFGSKQKDFAITQQKLKPVCPSCQRDIDSGHCAFVTLDGKRYAMILFPPELASGTVTLSLLPIRGKIIVVTETELDALTATPIDGARVADVLERLLKTQHAKGN